MWTGGGRRLAMCHRELTQLTQSLQKKTHQRRERGKGYGRWSCVMGNWPNLPSPWRRKHSHRSGERDGVGWTTGVSRTADPRVYFTLALSGAKTRPQKQKQGVDQCTTELKPSHRSEGGANTVARRTHPTYPSSLQS